MPSFLRATALFTVSAIVALLVPLTVGTTAASAQVPSGDPEVRVIGSAGRVFVVAESAWTFQLRLPNNTPVEFTDQAPGTYAYGGSTTSLSVDDWGDAYPNVFFPSAADAAADPLAAQVGHHPIQDATGAINTGDLADPRAVFTDLNGWGGATLTGLPAGEYKVHFTSGGEADHPVRVLPRAETMDDVPEVANPCHDSAPPQLPQDCTALDGEVNPDFFDDYQELVDQELDPADSFGYLRVRDGMELGYTLRLPPVAEGEDCERDPEDFFPEPDPDRCRFPTVLIQTSSAGSQPALHPSAAEDAGNADVYFDPRAGFLSDPDHPEQFSRGDLTTSVALLQGFAVLAVEQRGTGCSDGAYDLWETPQSVDGYDIIETAAAQPWSNGRVGMVGSSGEGLNQLQIAPSQPPHLAIITPANIPNSDPYQGSGRPGGTPNQHAFIPGLDSHEYPAQAPTNTHAWVRPEADAEDAIYAKPLSLPADNRYLSKDSWVPQWLTRGRLVPNADEEVEADLRQRCRDHQLLRGQSLSYTGFADSRGDIPHRDSPWPDGREPGPMFDRFAPESWVTVGDPDSVPVVSQLPDGMATVMISSWHEGTPNYSDLWALLPDGERFLIGGNGTHEEQEMPEVITARLDFLRAYLLDDEDLAKWEWNPDAQDLIEHHWSAKFRTRWNSNEPDDSPGFHYSDSGWDPGSGDGPDAETARGVLESLATPVRIRIGNGAVAGTDGAEYGFPRSVTGPYLQDPSGALGAQQLGFATWPPPLTNPPSSLPWVQGRSWYLTGDTVLVDEAPEVESGWRFRWDPSANPNAQPRTVGLAEGDPNAPRVTRNWMPEPVDNGLTFTSEALTERTLMAGSGSVDLWVGAHVDSGTAVPDVDHEVMLLEVDADGNETYIQSGYLRTSERTLEDEENELDPRPTGIPPTPAPAALTASPETPVRIRIRPFAHQFAPGTRVRIQIEAPNGNRDAPWIMHHLVPDLSESGTTDDGLLNGQAVRVEVGSDESMRSRIVLPVVHDVPAGLPAVEAPCGAIRSQGCRGPNLLPFSSATLEHGPQGWAARGATVARSAAFAEDGAANLRVEGTSTSAVAYTDIGTHGFAVTPGTVYSGQVTVRRGDSSCAGASPCLNVVTGINWLRDNGAIISTSVASPVTLSTDTPTVVQVAAKTAPPRAAYGVFFVALPNLGTGRAVHLDDAGVVTGSTPGSGTNLLAEAPAGFEVGEDDVDGGGDPQQGGWVGNNNDLARTTVEHHPHDDEPAGAGASLALVPNPDDTAEGYPGAYTSGGHGSIPGLSASTQYTFSFYAKTPGTGRLLPIIRWLDSGGVTISSAVGSTTTAPTSWTDDDDPPDIRVTGTSPANTARAQLGIIACDDAGACNNTQPPTFFIDDVSLVTGATAGAGTNLAAVNQSTFENDALGWSSIGVDIERTSQAAHYGAGALALRANISESVVYTTTPIDLTAGVLPRFSGSAWFKGSTTGGSVQPSIIWLDDEGDVIDIDAGHGTSVPLYDPTAIAPTDGSTAWRQIGLNLRANGLSEAPAAAVISFKLTGLDSGEVVYLDDAGFCQASTLSCANPVPLP